MQNKKIYLIIAIFIFVGGLLFYIYSQPKQKTGQIDNITTNGTVKKEDGTSMANPASVNCEKMGGKLSIEKKPGGGEYGVCIFGDNRQCEEWALFRGECPAGGIKVTGFITDVQKYCAITGGSFIPDKKEPGTEKGTCKLPDGSICDSQDYYEGKCPNKEQTPSLDKTSEIIKATFLCKNNKSIEAEFATSSVSLKLSDERTVKLNQALSASGARYANKDESFVFWNKGNTAFIEENNTITFQECVEKNPR